MKLIYRFIKWLGRATAFNNSAEITPCRKILVCHHEGNRLMKSQRMAGGLWPWQADMIRKMGWNCPNAEEAVITMGRATGKSNHGIHITEFAIRHGIQISPSVLIGEPILVREVDEDGRQTGAHVDLMEGARGAIIDVSSQPTVHEIL